MKMSNNDEIWIEKYNEGNAERWDRFVTESKMPLFLFYRGYMDYHKDRFTDSSLMLYKDGNLVALLPLSINGHHVISHGGLTFGGFITGKSMKQKLMNDCFKAVMTYLKLLEVKDIIYKCIPHIFHSFPAEEDRYSLFLCNAEINKIEPSVVLDFYHPIKMAKGRKSQISKAKREGVFVRKEEDAESFLEFIDLENSVLKEHHNVSAVHSGKEMAMLHDKFSDHISLFSAYYDGQLVAGAIIYDYGNTIHTQYLAANSVARELGALDLVIDTVIKEYSGIKRYLDFGISTEKEGRVLNEGLIFQKEGFGGRVNTYETWKIII